MEKNCMNYKILGILAVLFMIGMASAVEELSGTDPSKFDQPKFTKYGINGNSPQLTASMKDFLKTGNETNASIPGMKVLLLGSRVPYNRSPSPEIYYTPEQFADIMNSSARLEFE